jgi:Domain of unknown function (DUF4157)
MSYNSRNYRHRNPKTGDEQKTSTPFFNSPSGSAAQKKNGSAVQRKKGSAFFQAKLTVGQPGDVYEKEADSVASQVVNRQNDQKAVLQEKESDTVRRLATSKEDEKLGTHDARMEKDKEEPMKPVQKKQGPGDEKKKEKGVHKMDDPKKKKKELHKAEDPQKKKKKMPEGMVQKKEENTAPPDLAAELEAQSGKGSPLPAETLAEMNRSFGMDFSSVRVHHDAAAVRLCCELNAQAFTHGHDIYFNEGKYNPASAEGKHLLAHELTHVAQQNS